MRVQERPLRLDHSILCMANAKDPLSNPSKTIELSPGEMVPVLNLDNAYYPIIEEGDAPDGFYEVEVKLADNGEKLPCIRCMMVSGHLVLSVEGEKKDTI